MGSEASFGATFRLAREMRRRCCRLAHFHDAHGAAVGGRAASWAKVPLRIIHRRVDFPIKKNAASKRKYTKDVDAIIAISEGVKKVLVEGGIPDTRIEVITSGIDFSPFEEVGSRDFLRREFSFGPDEYLTGIVAALEDHKGHTFLFRAAKILKKRAPGVRLVVVGSGSLEMELHSQVRDLGVEDIVYFLGFRDDVPRILASLDLFVLSSHLEGLGSSLLDAMASRLPVVATRTGGIPEIVIEGQTGLLVPPKEPEALAEAIIKLYRDRDLAARLAGQGYEFVHKGFSAAAMAEKVLALYRRLAAEKGIKLDD